MLTIPNCFPKPAAMNTAQSKNAPVKCLHASRLCSFPPETPRTQLNHWTWPFVNSLQHPKHGCRHPTICHSVTEIFSQTFPGSICWMDWEMLNWKPGREGNTCDGILRGKEQEHQLREHGGERWPQLRHSVRYHQ